MTIDQDQAKLLRFVKIFLGLTAALFAIAASILIIFSTSAATVTGRTPMVPLALIDGMNTGILGPGEQRWFKFNPNDENQAAPVEQSLTLIFTPGDGQHNRQVALQIFEPPQLQFFYDNDTSKMANLGAGQVVSRDNNPETGELFWTGWLPGQQSYYLQIMNSNNSSIDYWLFTENVRSYPLGEPETSTTTNVAPRPTVAPGDSPQTAIPLKFGQNRGRLEPGKECWYSFSLNTPDDKYFEEMALTMIVTPDDNNRIRYVSFDIFTTQGIQNWSPDNKSGINNMGAGSIVYRDDNPLTGERFWTGWVVDGDIYYVRVSNEANVPMDYWLFTGDIYHPELAREGSF